MPKRNYYRERLKKGLCGLCGKDKPNKERALCLSCAEKRRAWNKAHPDPEGHRSRRMRYRLKHRLEIQTLRVDVILWLGGKCSLCGYDRNTAALDLHHIHKKKNRYSSEARKGDPWALRKRRLEEVIKNPQHFELICANCHREIHNPNKRIN